MGICESSDAAEELQRTRSYDFTDTIMLFGATVSPRHPSDYPMGRPLPTAPMPVGFGERLLVNSAVSEAHAGDQIHCALCGKEFLFFFGVRNRRWCRSCGKPVCQRCTSGSPFSVRVTCRDCGDQGQANPSDQRGPSTECEVCHRPFSFFRPKRHCRQCKIRLCAVCSVVPFARRGAYHEEATCPPCAYGIDTRARPRGVNLEVLDCQLCSAPFRFFRRRHWCRRCGATICHQCTPSTLFLTARRHPNCICKACHVPAIFQLSHQLAKFCFDFLDPKSQDRCLKACTWFQTLVSLPFPLISSFSARYRVDREEGLLGSGGFGKVYHCVCRMSLQPYAVKVIPKRRMFSLRQWSIAMREIDIQSSIDHPNSVKLFQVLQTPSEVFLVMELATGSDLAQFCLRSRRLPERQIAHITCQMLRFLAHLHSRSVVHRDIKPDNILLSMDGNDVKVADFGLAKFVEPSGITNAADIQSLGLAEDTSESRAPVPSSSGASPGSLSYGNPSLYRGGSIPAIAGPLVSLNRLGSETAVSMRSRQLLGASPASSSGSQPPAMGRGAAMRVLCTPCGTLPFCAPEVLNPTAYRKKHPYRRVFKRDLYSLGVVLYFLLAGRLPFSGTTAEALREQQQKPLTLADPPWQHVSSRAKDLCLRLMALLPDERLSAEEALRHDWIAPLAFSYELNALTPSRRRDGADEPPSPLSSGHSEAFPFQPRPPAAPS